MPLDYRITLSDLEPAIAAMNKAPHLVQEALSRGMTAAVKYTEGVAKQKTPEANTRQLRPFIQGYETPTEKGLIGVVESSPTAIAYAHVIEKGYGPLRIYPTERIRAWAKFRGIKNVYMLLQSIAVKGIRAQEPFGKTFRESRPVIERMILSEVEKI